MAGLQGGIEGSRATRSPEFKVRSDSKAFSSFSATVVAMNRI